MPSLIRMFFLVLFFIFIFNPLLIGMLFILFPFILILFSFLGVFRIYFTRDYSYSRSREFEFYKLSFLLMSKLLSILGTVTGEQLNYVNFIINSLNLSERGKSELYTIFHSAITKNNNADKILYTLKLGYFQHKDLFIWLFASLKEINRLSRYKNLEAEKFISYVGVFLELESDSYEAYKDINIKIVNPYSVLGLTYTASDDEIKKAYKSLVIKYHPDKFANDPVRQKDANDKFIKIQDAYEKICKERNMK
ncbi:J domain-containing protein [Borreliella lusitaniae]|uniref:J domain-containing protein n=1 Tax=Borreliella lusitaniae TaxID=100177 RepID=UPI00293147D3|nr:J domain-containing protein [Borreliella lusitaniae]WNY66940.1 J domain-containing protein [Borreliella lusitaniae]